MMEGGFALDTSAELARMDKHWTRLRSRSAASEAAAFGICSRTVSGSRTQPMEEPDNAAELI